MQGIRRVVAVTSAEAEAAVARAEALSKAMEAAHKLAGPALEAQIATLRQVRSPFHLLCITELWTCQCEAVHSNGHL